MIEMGLIVALGLMFLFSRLSWRKRMWMLSHPLALDLLVFIFVNALHWGTFSGLMVAAVAALFCSLSISLGRKAFGFIDQGTYKPGWFDIQHKL